jgi:hypothetical protein
LKDERTKRFYAKGRRLQHATGVRYYGKIQNAAELDILKEFIHKLMHVVPGLIVLQL